MTSCKLPTPGRYEFNWTEYYWDNAETVELSGELGVDETDETTEGIPEFAWSWGYTVEGEWEAAIGKTWREFVESLENLTFLSIDVSSFVDEIHELLGTSEYAEILSDKYEISDAKEAEKREEDKRKAKVKAERAKQEAEKTLKEWREGELVKKLISSGYQLDTPGGLGALETSAIDKTDLNALESLIQLNHRPKARDWWDAVLRKRNLEHFIRLAGILDFNEKFRKQIWFNAHTAEYPITLTIKSGWQQGLDQLVQMGVNTKELKSMVGGGEIKYYDLPELCASHGVDSSSIDK